MIVDPGIKNETGYAAYDEGLQSNSFIKVRLFSHFKPIHYCIFWNILCPSNFLAVFEMFLECFYAVLDSSSLDTCFQQDKNGNVFIGKVWPGYTAFPDFANFDTHKYWQNQVRRVALASWDRQTRPD